MKMVASFIKLDTIPRIFSYNFKEIEEFTNKLSFVTNPNPKKKCEAMSEVQVFSPRLMICSFWKSLLKTLKSNIFFFNYITLEHDITFTFILKLSF